MKEEILDLIDEMISNPYSNGVTDTSKEGNGYVIALSTLRDKVSQMQLPVGDDCERLYISEIDYFVDGQKKYYHIKVINRTDKFIEFEWVWSGAKQLMPLKRFNAIYKIEEELASNSR